MLGISEEEARGALRLPARGAALRRAAARRHRARHRPHRGDPRRARLDPRRDRVPQDRERRRSAHRRPAPVDAPQLAELGLARGALRRRHSAPRHPLRRKVTLRTRAGSADRGPDMSQISPPIRILLVAVIGLCAVYCSSFVPSEEAAPAAPRRRRDAGPRQGPRTPDLQQARRRRPAGRPRRDNAAARADEAAGGATARPSRRRSAADARQRRREHGPVAEAPATGQTAAPARRSPRRRSRRCPRTSAARSGSAR